MSAKRASHASHKLPLAFEPAVIALSMFSRIPMPVCAWRTCAMRWVLCWWPLVGVLEGIACIIWWSICRSCVLPHQLVALGLLVLPYLITGGIHADGFADTVDGLASHSPKQRMLQIMADPHIGSFAVLALACLLIATYACADCLAQQWFSRGLWCVSLSFVLSRALAGLSVIRMPSAHPGGLADTFGAPAREAGRWPSIVLLFEIAIVAVIMAVAGGICGVAALGGALLAFAWYRQLMISRLGGITGDTSGWFVQVCELVVIAIVALYGAVI